MALCELVKFRTEKGLRLTGAYYRADVPRAAIIHVHGSCGNFYEAGFISELSEKAIQSNFSFLTFNLRAHDCIAEGYGEDGHFEYVGGSVQRFESCRSDIKAAVKFLRADTIPVFLEGHSLGCDRVIDYMLGCEPELIRGVVLLSPCDSYALHESFIEPETVEKQICRLKQSLGDDSSILLPNSEYGIRHADENYFIPVSRDTLLSIMEGPAFRLFNIARPWQFRIDVPGLVIIGDHDALQMHSPATMIEYLQERFRSLDSVILSQGSHDFEGRERQVSVAVMEFVQRVLEVATSG